MESTVTLVIFFTVSVAALLCFGVAGFGLIYSFNIRYKALAAPFAGILAHTLATTILYSVVGLQFTQASHLAFLPLVAGTIYPIATKNAARQDLAALLLCLPVIAISVFLFCFSSAKLGMESHYGAHAVEQANYGAVADWIRQFPASYVLHDPSNPENEEFARRSLIYDPRLGSFIFLAFWGILDTSPTPSLSIFHYNFACGVIFAAGVLSLAGVFCRTFLSILFVIVALFVSAWFETGFNSYLAKLIHYPAAIMIAGLFIQSSSDARQRATLVILTAAAASTHSGVATVVLTSAPILTFLTWKLIDERRFPSDQTYLWMIMSLMAVAVTGALSRNYVQYLPDVPIPPWNLAAWILDIQSQLNPSLSNELKAATVVGFACLISYSILSVLTKNRLAAAFSVGPLTLAFLMWFLAKNITTFQLLGYLYPASVVSIAALSISSRIWSTLAIATIAVRAPHFAESLKILTLNPITDRLYSSQMIREIEQRSSGKVLLIDTASPQAVHILRYFLKDQNTQWSEQAWIAGRFTPNATRRTGRRPDLIIRHASEEPRGDGKVIWRSESLVLYDVADQR